MSIEQAEPPRLRRVEVVVATLVLGFVLAMTAPCVSMVAIAAHRTQCLNNLKQVALAVHAYHAAHDGRLPTGTIVASAKDSEEWLSLFVSLLPYLESRPAFESFDLALGWQAKKNELAVA